MKKINQLFVLILVFSVFAVSCGKDGATGPQGAKGDQGLVGPAGPTGANGQAGSQIYAGTADPSASTGVNGDYYLNKTTSNLFGPKSDSGWGTGTLLKGAVGATGATGAAGNTVLSGTGVPAASLGKTGDFYLDKSTFLLYGPKTATGWGVATSLKGPAGTANVEFSGWNYADNLSLRDTIIDNSALKVANLTAPALTSSILNNAVIEVFFEYDGTVLPLPYTSYAGGKVSVISFIPQVGRFIMTRFATDNTSTVNLSSVIQYRYVIIPGSIALSLKRNHVDMSNYDAVSQFINAHQ